MTNSHCLPGAPAWNSHQLPCPGIGSARTTISDVGAGKRRGRFIFFPSTGGVSTVINATTGASSGLNAWTTNMNNDGWQVVGVNSLVAFQRTGSDAGGNPAQPSDDILNDANHGTRFLNTCLFRWDHIMQWCAANAPGGMMPTGVAGFSFGAFEAIQVALNKPDCIGYASRSAPSIWSQQPVAALFGGNNMFGQNTTGANILNNPLLTLTGCSVSGGTLTCTVSSLTGSGIATNTWVAVLNSSGVDGTYQVTGTSGGNTITMASGASNGNYLNGTSTTIDANTALNNLTTPLGWVGWGDTSELVQWQDLSSMCSNASANTSVTGHLFAGSGHVWDAATTTQVCGASSGWVQTNLDPLYPKNF